ncbi:hypothetical protein VN97_g10429 [Penicillium thymicola]|uniref:Uncharacterized protein n=1 Tax=Penicillium thymicola TaxID=293382 RepID=A0AAI9TAH8_PENTH|nr:hypothetical protein VN97_g10429 [Penicillium thymicola]
MSTWSHSGILEYILQTSTLNDRLGFLEDRFWYACNPKTSYDTFLLAMFKTPFNIQIKIYTEVYLGIPTSYTHLHLNFFCHFAPCALRLAIAIVPRLVRGGLHSPPSPPLDCRLIPALRPRKFPRLIGTSHKLPGLHSSNPHCFKDRDIFTSNTSFIHPLQCRPISDRLPLTTVAESQ